jgi:very-short-patch-repair endonuclease
MEFKKNDIPWKKLIAFHQEIAKRAEESFFSLRISQYPTERWTSIDDYELNSYSGPWKINLSQISDPTFASYILAGNIKEVFLGGPCYLKWHPKLQNNQRTWIPNWRPMFYKKVELSLNENTLTILPDQANWEISPLIIDYLNNKGFAPETPYEEVIPTLIERASSIQSLNNCTLSESLRQTLIGWCSDIEDLFVKTLDNDHRYKTPSEWVLFTPPSAGPITRYQISDYKRILNILESYPQKIGGLKIYEGYPEQRIENIEILPIVQLNESQKKAVSCSLSSSPATVISGPPGCGKSQVVVSILLNAWASGKSVLFASNNNQAVDVVFERLQRFESNFPIAIRSGAKKHNRILAQLRDTINFLTGNRTRTLAEIKKIHDEIIKLEEQLQKTKEFIDSKIPHKVDEAQQAAAQAYKKYKELTTQIEHTQYQLQREYKLLNLPCSINKFELTIKKPYRDWLDKRIEHINKIQDNDRKNINIESEAKLTANIRNQILSSFGMDIKAVQSWSWLSNTEVIKILEAWHSKISQYLKNPIEQELVEIRWNSEFNRWKSEEDAKQWSENASKLAEEIYFFMTIYENKTKRINKINSEYEQAQKKIEEYGIYEIKELERSIFDKWVRNFNDLSSLTKKQTDWLPFSERSIIVRKLKKEEATFRSMLPISVWRKVGPVNEAGRQTLATIIEDILIAINYYNKWKQIESEKTQLESQADSLIKRTRDLFFKIKVNLISSETYKNWEKLKGSLLQYSELALQASDAIAKKTLKEEIQNQLNSLISEFNITASGIPLKETWLNKQGRDLNNILNTLKDQALPKDIVRTREILYSNTLLELCDVWKKASELQNKYELLNKQLLEIPAPEQIIYKWWSLRPSFLSSCFDLDEITKTFSNIDSIKQEDNIFTNHYEKLINWHNRWLKFKKTEEPKLLSEIHEEKKWAIGNLKTAINSLPQKEKKHIHSRLNEILDNIEIKWPTDQLSEIFQNYSLSHLNAQLDSLNNRLEQLSFEKAKADWIKRQVEDIETQHALDKLYDTYNRNKLEITEDQYECYKQALKAVPVWITTAQAPYSIPLQENIFDMLVIDEATQCTVTNIIPLIYRASKVVIIGDQEQLPSIPNISVQTENSLAEKFQVENSLPILGHVNNNIYKSTYSILPNRRFDVILLDEHYRSHPLIIGFSNLYIYQKNLKLKKDPNHLGDSVYRHNIQGSCQRGKYGTSWINPQEVKAVISLISSLKSQTEGRLSYGVVTPFKSHFTEIQNQLQQYNLDEGVKCGTAHQFQGDERDIMIFSAVVSNGIADSAVRWVQEPKNLINVAITRARQSLYVVADYHYCSRCKGILKDLIDYVDKIELLRETSNAELSLFSWMIMEGWNPSVHEVIGDIEVDFILRSNTSRLAIEVDGRQHYLQKIEDQGRDAFLTACNYKVIRLPAREVLETPSISISKIKEFYS